MKHLRKFNEAETPKYEMELKDYFYDFTDNGFVVDIEGNVIKGKYTGNYDFTDSVEMFLDTATKLKHYFGISKTSFANSMTATSFLIEVNNKMDDINSIEVTLKKSGTRLELKIYDMYITNNNKAKICSILLYGMDVNNKSYSIRWYSGDYNIEIDERCSFKVNGVNSLIDLKNVNKVYDLILSNNISKVRMDVSKIDPNILVKI